MMDEPKTASPATAATPETNGHTADSAAIPPVSGDPAKLPLTPEGWEYLADLKWVNEQFNLGRWEPYMGNYIAVYRKQLLGFGPDLLALRERMAKEYHVSEDRILTSYVESPIES
jgi:hypothetical protein